MKKFKAIKVPLHNEKGEEVTTDEKGNPIKFTYADFAIQHLRKPVNELNVEQLFQYSDLINKLKNLKIDQEIELNLEEWSILKNNIPEKFDAVFDDLIEYYRYIIKNCA